MTAPTPDTRHRNVDTYDDQRLFDRVMAPYASKGTIYLSGPAQVRRAGGTIIGSGEFAIPSPCYIDDTGHFNAAEYIICYNQIMYYTLAAAVRDHLTPEFAHWTLDDYWARQLPNVLIAKTDIKFSRPIDSAKFAGEFTVESITERISSKRMLLLDTTMRFTDEHGGRCAGSIGLAIIEPPLPQ